MEGSRPLLVEVQALVSPVASSCRRAASSTASTATASRSCSPSSPATPASASGSADVFVNVAGGVKIDEPGADLAVALAVASAARGVALERGGRPLACFGELGLTGEVRTVAPRRPPRRRGAKFGLETVDRPTLKQALNVLETRLRPQRRVARLHPVKRHFWL